MRKTATCIAFFTLFSGAAFAGGCELGPAALNLIRTANHSTQSVDTAKKENEEMDELYRKADTLLISFAIDFAVDWRKMWSWNRNIFGLVSSDTIRSINQKSDEAGLNDRVWHASRIDSDEILSAKTNVIKAALHAKSYGLLSQGYASTNRIQSVTPANSEEAAFEILAHTYADAARKKRQYSYWLRVKDALLARLKVSFGSVSMYEIKLAFETDHPLKNDAGDAEGLTTLTLPL